jgi:hypothetical protein
LTGKLNQKETLKMKKLFLTLGCVLVAASVSLGAFATIDNQDATKTGLPSFASKVNANFALVPSTIVTGVTAQTASVSGTVAKSTAAIAATVTPQVVTPTATPTLQTAALTATATVEGPTLQLKGVDDSTNSIVSVTNVVVTISNGDAVVTNLSIAVTPDLCTNATVALSNASAVMTNATVTTAGIVTNVTLQTKSP